MFKFTQTQGFWKKLFVSFALIFPILSFSKINIINPYINLSGYIQWYSVNDGYYFGIDRSEYMRRGRPQLVGKINDFSYEIEYGFELRENWRNLWGEYKNKLVQARVGQFRPPFNSVENQSSQYHWFLERALPFRPFSALFRRGGMLRLLQPKWNFAVSFFAPSIQAQKKLGPPYGSTQRLLIFPVKQKNKIVQIGLGNWYQNTKKNNRVNYQAIPEATGFSPIFTISTGRINNVKYHDIIGADGLFQYKRFATQIGWT